MHRRSSTIRLHTLILSTTSCWPYIQSPSHTHRFNFFVPSNTSEDRHRHVECLHSWTIPAPNTSPHQRRPQIPTLPTNTTCQYGYHDGHNPRCPREPARRRVIPYNVRPVPHRAPQQDRRARPQPRNHNHRPPQGFGRCPFRTPGRSRAPLQRLDTLRMSGIFGPTELGVATEVSLLLGLVAPPEAEGFEGIAAEQSSGFRPG